MNLKRLALAIMAAFVFIFVSDILIHGVWLEPIYKATASLWRPEAEITARMPVMFVAQLLCAVTFVVLWAKGFAARGDLKLACEFGVLIGLMNQVGLLIQYVVAPVPESLVLKWIVSSLAQSLVLAIITFYVYKPATAKS